MELKTKDKQNYTQGPSLVNVNKNPGNSRLQIFFKSRFHFSIFRTIFSCTNPVLIIAYSHIDKKRKTKNHKLKKNLHR